MSDIQSISISGDTISGTLKYCEGVTAFEDSGDLTKGYFTIFKVNKDADISFSQVAITLTTPDYGMYWIPKMYDDGEFVTGATGTEFYVIVRVSPLYSNTGGSELADTVYLTGLAFKFMVNGVARDISYHFDSTTLTLESHE